MLIPSPILIAITLSCLVVGTLCIYQARRLLCQRKIHEALNLELSAAFQCLLDHNDPSAAPVKGQPPDHTTPVEGRAGSYSHVAALTRRGMDADAIAEILDVSPNIAKQMVTLSEVARKHQKT